MRVRLVYTIDLDSDGWAEEYGMDPEKKRLIRQDFKIWASSQLHLSIHGPSTDTPLMRSIEEE